MRAPERFVVAHPFNPVYLLPLVELCGGRADRARSARARGRGVRARRDATAHGAAPRSTASSPTGCSRRCGARRCGSSTTTSPPSRRSTTRSASAPACAGRSWGRSSPTASPAARRACAISSSSSVRRSQAPWTKLVDVPELDAASCSRSSSRSPTRRRGGAVDPTELERMRDDCLVARAAGPARPGRRRGRDRRATWERGLIGAPRRRARRDWRPPRPLALLERAIPPEWIDYNGHVHREPLPAAVRRRDRRAAAPHRDRRRLSRAARQLLHRRTHLSHLRELFAGDRRRGRRRRCSGSRRASACTSSTCCCAPASDDPVATAEQMLLHVDAIGRRASAVRDGVGERLAHLVAAHAALPRPERVGRRITPP